MPPLLWAEFSIQFLIPAIFLVIWALNQVFGRAEAPPAPGPRDRIGPRPIPPGPSRAPQPANRGQAAAGRPDGSRSSPSSSSPNRPGASRPPRRASSRPAGAGPDRSQAPPAEPAARPRPTSSVVEQMYAIYDDDRAYPRTVDAPPPSPVSAAELRPTPKISDAEEVPEVISGLDRLMRAGIDRGRLREAILLNEILGPSVAVRRSRNRAPGPIARQQAAGQGGDPSGSEGMGGSPPGESP